ncbi:MAG: hypothetical protein AAF772_00400 [Acidobacteriota bacterium]
MATAWSAGVRCVLHRRICLIALALSLAATSLQADAPPSAAAPDPPSPTPPTTASSADRPEVKDGAPAQLPDADVPAAHAAPAVDGASGTTAARSGSGKAMPEGFPDQAAAHWARFLKTPDGKNAVRLKIEAKAQIEAEEALRSTESAFADAYIESIGPGNVGGRMRAIAVDPNDPDVLLAGSVSGGLLKTEDGGEHWRFVNDFMPTLAIGSLLVDPDDPRVVWAGTGEGYNNSGSAQGLGIYRSTDFGDTWTVLPSTETLDFWYVNRMARIPGTSVLVAATHTGLWRTEDDGVSWTRVVHASFGNGFTTVVVDPSRVDRLYAFLFASGDGNRRVYRSVDAGLSWQSLGDAEGLPTTNVGRMEIAVGTDGVVYVLATNGFYETRGLYRSEPGGSAFQKTAVNQSFIQRQGWYNLYVAVDPSNSDRVYVGAVNSFRSENAGFNFRQIGSTNRHPPASQSFVHADAHALVFHPTDPSVFWIATDGGVFRGENYGAAFTDLNNDVRVTQPYDLAVHPDGTRAIIGTQDNGTLLYHGDDETWLWVVGGDGGFCAWDQQEPDVVWASTPHANLLVSHDGGVTYVDAQGPPDSAGSPFIAPFMLDPSDGSRLVVATDNIFFAENARQAAQGQASWQDVTGWIGRFGVSALEISPLDSTVAYVSNFESNLYRITDLGGANVMTDIFVDGQLWAGPISTIEVDIHDPTGQTLYVGGSGYFASRVWKTVDGGLSWINMSPSLPAIPVFDIAVDPVEPGRIWVATELGLWTTDGRDVGERFIWERVDVAVPWTRVTQLLWRGNTLWMSTYGRGVFRLHRSPLKVTMADALREDAACDGDHVLDDGERALLPVTIENRGRRAAPNVRVTLASARPDLTVLNETVDVGTIPAGGSVTHPFALTLDLSACLESIDVTATATTVRGVDVAATRTLPVGLDIASTTGTFADGAESADTLLTTELFLGSDGWERATTQAYTGTSSWYVRNEPNYADKSLISPVLEMLPGGNVLTFALYYRLENNTVNGYRDGTLLEMRIDDGDWFDIGHLSTVPYDRALGPLNSAGNRPAWMGTQTAWRAATVDLGTTYEGERIQFRFRHVSDHLGHAVGFWVDDIAMTNVRYGEAVTCDTGTCTAIFADDAETADTGRWSATIGGF